MAGMDDALSDEALDELLTMLEKAAGRDLRKETVPANDGDEILLADLIRWELLHAAYKYNENASKTSLSAQARLEYFSGLNDHLKHAQASLNSISDDYYCQEILYDALQCVGGEHLVRFRLRWDAEALVPVCEALNKLAEASEHAAQRASELKQAEPAGRKPLLAFRALIWRLAYCWEYNTKKNPTYKGAFAAFVERFCKDLAGQRHLEIYHLTYTQSRLRDFLREYREHRPNMGADEDHLGAVLAVMRANRTRDSRG